MIMNIIKNAFLYALQYKIMYPTQPKNISLPHSQQSVYKNVVDRKSPIVWNLYLRRENIPTFVICIRVNSINKIDETGQNRFRLIVWNMR